MSYDRSKVLAVAAGELGYLEKASNSQLDDKTANAGHANFTKYARDLDALGNIYNGPKQGFAYCDVGVDWCFVKAYGVEAALKLLCQPLRSAGAGCYFSAMYYRQRGQFHSAGSIPRPGDQIFFSYQAGEVSHTGLVESVSTSTVTCIEFNSSDGVYRRTYALNDSRIYGYGRPDWNMDSGDDASTPVEDTTDTDAGNKEDIVYVVKAGDTLSGIAAKYGTSYTALAAYNGISNPAKIMIGQRIKIPAYTNTPSASVPSGGTISVPSTSAYKIELPELKEGMSGSAVKAAQTLLILHGYTCGKIFYNGSEKADGDFGPITTEAVKKFQTDNVITVDGTIGAETMTALLK